jgi:hypothetical protein
MDGGFVDRVVSNATTAEDEAVLFDTFVRALV